MKILRVSLENLNSLRGPHEVNFEAAPLAGAGLFAITGPTGAGKSTLLDAITLALYGKAARYGTAPSPEDMMSRHCGECRAEVEFRVPAGVYRAEWQLHRARGKPDGKVQPARRCVYDARGLALAQNVRESEEWIERLIGLDYERFLRSAMLAQGQFAQFLKARPDERAELLERLTGTAVYSELGALAYAETTRREAGLQALESAVQQIPLLDEEQRRGIGRDMAAAQTEFDRARTELQQANDLLNKAANLAEALDRHETILRQQQLLETERTRAAPDLQRLHRHRLTVPFLGDLAHVESAEAAAGQAAGLLRQRENSRAEALRHLRRGLQVYRRLLEERIEAARKDIERCVETSRKAVRRSEAAAKWLKEHEADRALPGRLTDLAAALANLKAARSALAREWTRLSQLAAALDPQATAPWPASAEALDAQTAREFSERAGALAAARHAEAEAAMRTAETQLDAITARLEHARLVAGFDEKRAALKKGEPCPLCGSPDHPYAEGAPPSVAVKELEKRRASAQKALQESSSRFGAVRESESNLAAAGEALQAVFESHRQAREGLGADVAVFGLDLPAPGAEDEFKAALQLRAHDYQTQAGEVERAGQDQTNAAAEQTRCQSELARLQEKQAALAAHPAATPESQADPGPATAREEFPAPTGLTVEAAEEQWNSARTESATAQALYQSQAETKNHCDAGLAALTRTLSAKLAGSPFAAVADLKAARADPAEAARIEAVEAGLKTRADVLEADLRAARAAIDQGRKESAPEGEALGKLKSQRSELQARHDQFIRDIATFTNQLDQDDSNRRKVEARRRDLERDRQGLLAWQRLRGLVGSQDGRLFRRFAQGISLDILVAYANRHLHRLSDRYVIRRRPGDDLELEVSDLHQAGAVRPMASLSGGESFLASLALALGLSDIAGRNVRIESLFVDEGFGSLDAGSLDLAIVSLETLRQDNKTIGVISHVELLTERVAARIIVEKQAGGTSTLRLAS